MSSKWSFVFVFFCLSALFIPSTKCTVFFPVETNEESVNYRSLRDILFRTHSAFTAESSVVTSFRPTDPSPTLASPVEQIRIPTTRFLDEDALYGPPFYQSRSNLGSPASSLISSDESRNSNIPNLPELIQSQTHVRQSKHAAVDETIPTISTTDDAAAQDDRWPWPYSKSTQQFINPQGRNIQTLSPLKVKKDVAKPYRLLARTSSCPKLLHDLTVTCSLPEEQLSSDPVVFQWYKKQYRSAGNSFATNLVDSTIKIPIAHGTRLIHKDGRYGVSAISDTSSSLTIRQLKPQDCGSYTCEVLDTRNATIVSSSDFLIFLCY